MKTNDTTPSAQAGHLLQPLWDAFVPETDALPGRVGTAAYGLIGTEQPGSITYLAAVELKGPPDVLPDGWVHRVLPASAWAVFTHRGAVADLDRTVNDIDGCWLLAAGRAHTFGADLEVYDERYRPGDEASIVSPRSDPRR